MRVRATHRFAALTGDEPVAQPHSNGRSPRLLSCNRLLHDFADDAMTVIETRVHGFGRVLTFPLVSEAVGASSPKLCQRNHPQLILPTAARQLLVLLPSLSGEPQCL